MTSVLLEARPFRPFKSSEEYLVAMKEDLAEWLQTMYPHLNICMENFMEKLETGVALCEHANAVKAQAHEYVEKKQAKKVMTRSVTGSLAIAQNLFCIPEVKYFNTAKPGTFFARDNVSNFINWCKNSLKIIECLLFESDDLIMRKNEKHVVLCLLEVARRGAKFGMLAPMLVQMERQIDREIAADQKKLGVMYNENENDLDDDSDSDMEEEPVLMYGPTPQIITNDLKSLDEMVRDLVEKCTCPTQFPMIRVSEGKYRIGDTKVLIFVRILRNHVMVRVGGGWDTLSHYLDKHDPCRCRTQHRTTQSAKLVNKPGAADLHGSHVYYDRVTVPAHDAMHTNGFGSNVSTLGPPMNALNRSRSRSPQSYQMLAADSRRSVSPNFPRKSLMPPANRSRSPTPNYTSTFNAKLATNPRSTPIRNSGPASLPIMSTSPTPKKHVANMHIPLESKVMKTETTLHVNDTDHSDTTSEVSDEGYRSLGIIQDKTKQRSSLYSQNSGEDADETDHQQVFTEEELNDCGLRKTKYSEKLYMKKKLEQNLQSIEKLSLSPTESPEDRMYNDFFSSKSKDATLKQREKSFSNQSEKSVGSPRQSRINVRKENSFVDQKPPSRAQSIERKAEAQKSPRKSPAPAIKAESKINTWNGRSKNARPSLTAETYVSPFTRNSIGRRSVSAIGQDRRASSTNTSPKKSSLKQEVLNAIQHTDDDDTFVMTIKNLMKKHGSLSVLNDFDDPLPVNNGFTKNSPERSSFRSPRKDSKVHSNLSKIPAPVFYSKT